MAQGVLGGLGAFGYYNAAVDRENETARQNLQGVLSAGQAINQMQTAPLQRQLLQAQVAGAIDQQKQRAEMERVISTLPPEQQAFARIAPQQFVTNYLKAQEAATERGRVAQLASVPDRQFMAPTNDVEAKNPTVTVKGRPGVLSAFFEDPNIGPAARQVDEMASKGGYSDIKDFNAATDALMKLRTAYASKPAGSMHERAYQKLEQYQTKVDAGQALSPAEMRDAEAARSILGRQEMRVDPVTNRSYFVQPIQIPDSFTVGRTQGQSGSGVPVNQLPQTQGGRRPLDQKDEDALASIGKGYSQLNSLVSEADPKHFGFTLDVAGELATAVGRRVPDSRFGKTAEWWQRYEDWVADIRKDRFGATLTGNELANFEKYKVKSSDTPEIAAANIQRQVSTLERAAARKLNSLNQSGVNMSAAEALIGPMVDPKQAEAIQANPNPMFSGRRAIPQSRIPPAAVADLRANPGTAAQFDAVFGTGEASKILGK